MSRKKLGQVIKVNRISEVIKELKISNFIISLWTGVHIKTVSSWRNNTSQPSKENMNQLGELLEIDESLLKINHSRRFTGLAKALDTELKRLIKVDKITFEIEIEINDIKSSGKKTVKVINPELITKINLFAEEFKSKNVAEIPIYIDKSFSEISKVELKEHKIIICNADNNTVENPEFQVVHIGYGNKLVAKFNQRVDAENYVDLILRGYVQFEDKN
ncbi:hypothetical protein [Sphingobacterium kitahiroshimense]|uniref:HTH cro/C1-type domain-containing protein n=1 Tax=Sphingobacterium kitahiroshimense TaxID=470446 RepID=A0ABV0BQ75_9SPHI